MQRDARIDVIRGAGILMIALDHLGAVAVAIADRAIAVPFVTWTRIGWSSAAEFFVFFSGYLIGLVYIRTLQARGPLMLQARATHRSWEIYAANLLTLCVTLVLLFGSPLGSAKLIEASQLAPLMGEGAAASWVGFLSLQTAPMFFEILHLYVVLLIAAPLFLLLARVSMLAALALSISIWLAAQMNPSINVAAWHFNPFGWQVVFVLGMLCAVGNVFAKLEARFTRRSLLIATGALLLVALALKGVEKSAVALPVLGQIAIAGVDKDAVGPLRLLHFLAGVVFVMQLMPRTQAGQKAWPVRAVARIGRHSLECFCVSTLAVYVCAGMLLKFVSVTTATLLLGGVGLVAALIAFAVFMEWVKSEPWRGAGASRTIESRQSSDATPIEGSSAAGFGSRLTLEAKS